MSLPQKKSTLARYGSSVVLWLFAVLLVTTFLMWTQRARRADPAADLVEIVPTPAVKPMRSVETASTEQRSEPKTLDELWRDALFEPEDARRLQLLLQLARHCPLSNLSLLLEWAGVLQESEERFELRCALVSRWAKLDGAAAMAFVHSLPEGEKRQDLIPSVLSEWVVADASAATQ